MTIPNAPRLDVRDLRLVLALSELGTTAKAAPVLHLTQPAVSRGLLAAEDRLGVKLFERTPRGLLPTPAGETVIAGAGPLLASLADLEHRARKPAVRTRPVRLVCECYTAYHWLPSALGRMRDALPGLEVRLAVEHTSEPVEALARGDIDIALVTTAPITHGLEERPLLSDEVVFLVAPSHPLARKKTLTRADLAAATLLTSRVPASESHWFLRAVFGRSRPRLHFELLPLTEAILDVARAGMGVAILSEWIAQPHLGRGDLVAKRLASGALLRPWRIAWRPEVRDAALRLRSAIAAGAPRVRLTA